MRILALDHGTKRIGVAVSDELKIITVPIKLWDERLTSSQANKILIQSGVRRDQRKEKVDKMAAAILLQSYLDGI